MPLFVRAGAIIPYGPAQQYIGEKPAETLTLYIYTGADGQFTLYEDDGLTNENEKGAFAEIPLIWNDASHSLTIGQRTGSFNGMLTDRTFNIVLVTAAKPISYSSNPVPSVSVQYHGAALNVPLP